MSVTNKQKIKKAFSLAVKAMWMIRHQRYTVGHHSYLQAKEAGRTWFLDFEIRDHKHYEAYTEALAVIEELRDEILKEA